MRSEACIRYERLALDNLERHAATSDWAQVYATQASAFALLALLHRDDGGDFGEEDK